MYSFKHPLHRTIPFLLTCLIGLAVSCKKNNTTAAANANYFQLILDSDTSGFGDARVDPNLTNAWGLAINPNGLMWIAANATNRTVVYDTNGEKVLDPIAMSEVGALGPSEPSGVIFNPTTDFPIFNTNKTATFIWATESGALQEWASGPNAITVVDRSNRNVAYKGLAIANNNGKNYLYVTDFRNAKIDVFDNMFNTVTSVIFSDPAIPANYGPFNIACFGNELFVTYAAHQSPDNMDDSAGAGNGYVDEYAPDGTLLKRIAAGGALNSPWGLAQVPDNNFGLPFHAILVGNFGDGKINAYDSTGRYLGALRTNGTPISIDGLWALSFANTITGADPDKLYFTAGPMDENHGLFGFLHLHP
jgi:uncharacterized protein (TIGR03118 family)